MRSKLQFIPQKTEKSTRIIQLMLRKSLVVDAEWILQTTDPFIAARGATLFSLLVAMIFGNIKIAVFNRANTGASPLKIPPCRITFFVMVVVIV